MHDKNDSLASLRNDGIGTVNSTVAASNLFIGLAIMALLHFGRDIFVPVVIAALLSFALAPLVLLFRRWHAGRVGGVLAAASLVLLLIFGLGAVMAEQVAQLVDNLPRYEQTISDKVASLKSGALRPAIVSRLSNMLGDIRQEASQPQNQTTSTASHLARTPAAGTAGSPIAVQVQTPASRPIETIEAIGGPLVAPLARTFIVLVFVIFMLLFREDLRDRFVRLAGAQDLGRTSAAMDDAGRRLSRYFLTQAMVNASFGIFIGVGLWLIGIPNPVLWGVFAALVRFIPYIGAFIAASIPAALAIAVDPGWSMLIFTLGLFAVIELILGQIVEPLLYGRHTGLSPVAVIVAAAFWTWLWGPTGLLLSTPLTVCVMVLGRHVERFEFLHIILGDQPALTPEQSFFQRMLAGDPHEVADQAEKIMKEKSLCDYYDEIAVPGLMLARLDSQRGVLDSDRLRRVKDTVDEVVDDLADHQDIVPPVKDKTEGDLGDAEKESGSRVESETAEAPRIPLPVVSADALKPEWRSESAVLCVGARDSLDEAAAAMLAQLLEKHGLGTRIEPPGAVSTSGVYRLDTANVAMVCIACLGDANPIHRRYLVRRLRRRLPRAELLVVDLGTSADGERRHKSLPESIGADRHADSFRQAIEFCIEAAQETTPGSLEAASVDEGPSDPVTRSARDRTLPTAANRPAESRPRGRA